MNKKILFIHLMIILLFAGIFIYQRNQYLLLKKQNLQTNSINTYSTETKTACVFPTDTPNQRKFEDLTWKQFTNNELGISFEYPNNLSYDHLDTLRYDNVNRRVRLDYSFEVKKIITNDTVENWWKKNNSQNNNETGIIPANMTKTKFLNQIVYYFEIKDLQQVPGDFYIIPMNGYFLQINFTKPYRIQDVFVGKLSQNDCNPFSMKDIFTYINAEKNYLNFDDLIIKRILSSIKFL